MTHVYVISKDGKPLMPTTRCGHVRRLLKQRKARVVEREPFAIQLLYDTQDIVQPLYLGIDPGRTNVGVAVVNEKSETVFMAKLETRNKDVPRLMKARSKHRRKHRTYGRRKVRRRRAVAAKTVKAKSFQRILPGCEKPIVCHDIKNKPARFNNRARPKRWLTPTANHLLQTHLNFVRKIQRLLPISDVAIELNRFAFMQIDNPNIRKWQYQQGPLYGYDGIKNAVFTLQNGHCLFCKKEIEHYHHVIPVSKRGSDTIENRVGLCEKHHALVHTDESWAAKLESKKAGVNKKYGALSVLNQIIPRLIDELEVRFPNHISIVQGKDTKCFRERYDIDKDHHYDAMCIAGIILDQKPIVSGVLYQYKQYRRHDRQACHKENVNRVYCQGGKSVCCNRHKSFEQKADSLEQYRDLHTKAEISTLTVKKHPPIYKNLNRVLPGATILSNGTYHTLKGTTGSEICGGIKQPSYCVFESGEKARFSKCTAVRKNTGCVCIRHSVL